MLCICMCIYMFVQLYVYMCMHVYIHVCLYTYTCMYMYNIYIYKHMYIYVTSRLSSAYSLKKGSVIWKRAISAGLDLFTILSTSTSVLCGYEYTRINATHMCVVVILCVCLCVYCMWCAVCCVLCAVYVLCVDMCTLMLIIKEHTPTNTHSYE